MINPTVGTVVLYRAGEYDATSMQGDQPCAAIVTYVHSSRLVNLSIFDYDGNQIGRRSIILIQDGDDVPVKGNPYCEWMTYQKDVAAGKIAPTLHATDKA